MGESVSGVNAHVDRLFQFEGTEISLDDRMGIFITMNPGYAGRTELPESVKSLFRPVVCIVPDLQQICEIMLFSEGFLFAKVSVLTRNHALLCASHSFFCVCDAGLGQENDSLVHVGFGTVVQAVSLRFWSPCSQSCVGDGRRVETRLSRAQ